MIKLSAAMVCTSVIILAYDSGFDRAVAQGVATETTTRALPRCPTVEEQGAAAGQKRADGTPAAPVKPVEQSIILPSAGDPPAQAGGGELRAGVDCLMAPSHPNAIKPADEANPPVAPTDAARK